MTEIGKRIRRQASILSPRGSAIRRHRLGGFLRRSSSPGFGLVHRARAVDRHGVDGRRDRGGKIAPDVLASAGPRLVEDQVRSLSSWRWRWSSSRSLPPRRPRVPARRRATPRCAEHWRRNAPGEAGRPGVRSDRRTAIDGSSRGNRGLRRCLGTRRPVRWALSRPSRSWHVRRFMMDGDKAWALVPPSATLVLRRDHDQLVMSPSSGSRLPAWTLMIGALRRCCGRTLPGPRRARLVLLRSSCSSAVDPYCGSATMMIR